MFKIRITLGEMPATNEVLANMELLKVSGVTAQSTSIADWPTAPLCRQGADARPTPEAIAATQQHTTLLYGHGGYIKEKRKGKTSLRGKLRCPHGPQSLSGRLSVRMGFSGPAEIRLRLVKTPINLLLLLLSLLIAFRDTSGGDFVYKVDEAMFASLASSVFP